MTAEHDEPQSSAAATHEAMIICGIAQHIDRHRAHVERLQRGMEWGEDLALADEQLAKLETVTRELLGVVTLMRDELRIAKTISDPIDALFVLAQSALVRWNEAEQQVIDDRGTGNDYQRHAEQYGEQKLKIALLERMIATAR